MEKAKSGIFLTFNMGDVEDPDMYANLEVDAWAKQNRAAYNFLLEHSDGNVRIHRQELPETMGHKYMLTAKMTEQDWAYYYLRFDDVSRH